MARVAIPARRRTRLRLPASFSRSGPVASLTRAAIFPARVLRGNAIA